MLLRYFMFAHDVRVEVLCIAFRREDLQSQTVFLPFSCLTALSIRHQTKHFNLNILRGRSRNKNQVEEGFSPVASTPFSQNSLVNVRLVYRAP